MVEGSKGNGEVPVKGARASNEYFGKKSLCVWEILCEG